MIPEDQDPVWKLLSASRPARVDPLFSRNVARAARLSAEAEARRHPRHLGWAARLRRALSQHPLLAWGLPAAAAAALVVLGIFAGPSDPGPDPGLAAGGGTPPVPAATGQGLGQDTGSPAGAGSQVVDTVFTEISSLEEELDQLDRLDQLIAAQDTQAIDDQLIADMLF